MNVMTCFRCYFGETIRGNLKRFKYPETNLPTIARTTTLICASMEAGLGKASHHKVGEQEY